MSKGKSFLGQEKLLNVIPGSYPVQTKKGGIRPLVLSVCMEAKKQVLDWYFAIVQQYKDVVKLYRKNIEVEFPKGTFRPPGICFT